MGLTTQLMTGDVRSMLAKLPAASVHCVVTSPPYFGLRSYLDKDHPDKASEIGTERTPEGYAARLVEIFRDVKRVLRDDGTVWLNLGDSYAGSWGNQGRKPDRGTQRPINTGMIQKVHDGRYGDQQSNTGKVPLGYKPKDLFMIPASVAFALRADGWYLRSAIVWAKGNPMPESITSRPTSSYEHVFLLTKRDQYFYDAEAIRENAVSDHPSGNGFKRDSRLTYKDANGARGNTKQWSDVGGTRNARNVWTINAHMYKGAHFATMPPALAERCIKAGTSEKGCCVSCAAPWQRIVVKGEPDEAHRAASGADKSGSYRGRSTKDHDTHGVQNASDVKRRILEGMRLRTYDWQPTCKCQDNMPVPCTVLDPFGGTGTTGLAANKLGHHAVLIDINEKYRPMAIERLSNKGVDLISEPDISTISTANPRGSTIMDTTHIPVTLTLPHNHPHLPTILQLLSSPANSPIAGNAASISVDKAKAPLVMQAHPSAELSSMPAFNQPSAPVTEAKPIEPAMPAASGKRGRQPDSPEVKADKAFCKASGQDYKAWVAAGKPRPADPAKSIHPAEVASAPAPEAAPVAQTNGATGGFPGLQSPVAAAPASTIMAQLAAKFAQVNTTHGGQPFKIMHSMVPACFEVEKFPEEMAPTLLAALNQLNSTPV